MRENFRNKLINKIIYPNLKTKIKFHNSIVLWEPSTSSHGEILPGFTKYLLDLGYKVYIFANTDRYEEKLFCKFKSKDIYFNKISQNEIYDIFYQKELEKCRAIIITTSRNVLDLNENYEKKLKFFNNNIRNKILLVEHDIKIPVDKGFINDNIITIFNTNYKNSITKMVNPHYFGKVKITNKNKNITKFIAVGETNINRKKKKIIFDLIKKLICNGITNFKFIIIGRSNLEIDSSISKFIEITGRLDFENMYKRLEEADFLLPLLDPNIEEHNRYISTGTSGSFQLIYGFIKPPIIHKKFADYYGFNYTNSIVYENDIELYIKLIESIKLSQKDYKLLQNNLKLLVNNIEQHSLNELKYLINNIGE